MNQDETVLQNRKRGSNSRTCFPFVSFLLLFRSKECGVQQIGSQLLHKEDIDASAAVPITLPAAGIVLRLISIGYGQDSVRTEKGYPEGP
jgi:hypothetical protein